MTNRLFKALHMSSAGFGPPGTLGKVDEPWGHTRSFGRNRPDQNDNPPAIGPAGTVHCSLDDLARYALFHLQGSRGGGRLKPEALRKLHTPPEGGDYACGWGCAQNPKAGKVLTHAGSNGSWFVFIWLAPEKDLAVIVGTNLGGSEAEQASVATAHATLDRWLAR